MCVCITMRMVCAVLRVWHQHISSGELCENERHLEIVNEEQSKRRERKYLCVRTTSRARGKHRYAYYRETYVCVL